MSKLLETLTNGNQRIAVTIDGEDLMAFVHAVYEDAQQKAAIPDFIIASPKSEI